jgi:hypothetical protein
MKRKSKLYTLLFYTSSLLAIGFCQMSFGQSDTSSVQITEEDAANSDFYYKSRYSYLDINLKEDRSLIKFGLFPYFEHVDWSTNASIRFQASYESKMGKQFSLTREINSTYTLDFQYYHRSRTGFGVTCRYYPGMKRRIESGNGADNLNGGYFALNLLDIVSFYTVREGTLPYGSKDSNLEFAPQLLISAGYQKRLTRLLYLDAQVYAGKWFDYNVATWGIKILMGVAFNPNDI